MTIAFRKVALTAHDASRAASNMIWIFSRSTFRHDWK
jgi:hypothetical protein